MFRSKLAQSWVLGIAIAAIAPSVAPSVALAQQPGSWLGGGTTVTADAARRLLTEVGKDPVGMDLLKELTGRLGSRSVLEVLRACAAGEVDPYTQGKTDFSWSTAVEARTGAEVGQTFGVEFDGNSAYGRSLIRRYYPGLYDRVAKLAPAGSGDRELSFEVKEGVVVARVNEAKNRYGLPAGICIAPNITLEDAKITMIHELVHYLHHDKPQGQVNVLDYRDARDYADRRIAEPGEEAEAHLTEWEALARAGRWDQIPEEAQDVVRSQGSREAAGQVLFRGKRWNYLERYLNEYSYRLTSTYNVRLQECSALKGSSLPGARRQLEQVRSDIDELARRINSTAGRKPVDGASRACP